MRKLYCGDGAGAVVVRCINPRHRSGEGGGDFHRGFHARKIWLGIPGFKMTQLKPYGKVEDAMGAKPDVTPYLCSG
jgi:hypothetical protein